MLKRGQRTEHGLQDGHREVCEDDGGVLRSSEQVPSDQKLGLPCLQAQLLQLDAFNAVAAAIRHHLGCTRTSLA